jgi:GDP-D-mannose 3',5'-epimerase
LFAVVNQLIQGHQEMIVVCGAGGFIGGHLVRDLLRMGEKVRAVDSKPLASWYQITHGAENLQMDLSLRDDCDQALPGASQVYNLACNMGGMGFIAKHKALCMLNVLINTHLLMAAQKHGVERYFFASSACVYKVELQEDKDLPGLKEQDVYPASPVDGYGWEKLFSERMCRHFTEDFGLLTRVARFHNIYGPHGAFDDGREKAPAAICRKVIEAKLSGTRTIEIWGDGSQTRSFTYIDDCLYGMKSIMNCHLDEPLNLGSSRQVSINQVVDIVEEIAGLRLERLYNLNGPVGVNGRNSDNRLIRDVLKWEPDTKLEHGLEHTYRWIYDLMLQAHPKMSPSFNESP